MSVTRNLFAAFYSRFIEDAHGLLDQVQLSEVEAAIEIIWQAYQAGNRVWVAGNGGSAATAVHFAGCLSHGTMVAGKPPLRCQSLCENITFLTAVANDYGYEHVFSSQLENVLGAGDVFIAISCSGNSPNVVSAAEYAGQHGAKVIAFLGFGGGKLKAIAHHCVYIENYNYGQVEALHLMLAHLISQFIKERIEAR